jgi:Flp pilus assembly protein TadG
MIELALVTPLALLLLAGVLDFALLLRTSTSLADAARAGAQYGAISVTNSTDIAGMQSAAVNAAPQLTGVTATAVRSCQCSDGSAVSCSGSCAGGRMLIYVNVTARASSSAIWSYPGLPFSGDTTATAKMRVQ